MELRPYQQDLVNKIRQAICSGSNRVCAVLGCGGGKSVIIATIAKVATDRGNRVLFLVHRKELTAQISRTMNAMGVDPFLCKVAMVQTMARQKTLARTIPPALIIVDEAHHSLAAGYLRIFDYFPQATVVGFTATPQRMGTGGLGKVFQSLVESVSTKWLIDNHYLAPYHLYSVPMTEVTGIHTRHGDYDQGEIAKLMDKGAIFGGTVASWKQRAEGKKTIVYCASIKSSKATAAAFQEQGIPAAHLDGATPKAERDTVEMIGSQVMIINQPLGRYGFHQALEYFPQPSCSHPLGSSCKSHYRCLGEIIEDPQVAGSQGMVSFIHDNQCRRNGPGQGFLPGHGLHHGHFAQEGIHSHGVHGSADLCRQLLPVDQEKNSVSFIRCCFCDGCNNYRLSAPAA